MPAVLSETRDGVARITLNKPETLNAFDVPMVAEFRDAVEDAADDEEARAVLVTGAGDAFCAGADVKAVLPEHANRHVRRLTLHLHAAVQSISHMEKPVVAAVNGVAAGGGMGLALACDVRLGSEKTRFKPAYLRIGLVPDGGITHSLGALAPGLAAALLLLDEPIDAPRALALGLVQRLVPRAALQKEAEALSLRLASGPRFAIAKTKRLLRLAGQHTLEEQLALERKFNAESAADPDFREGLAAFLQKREARFGKER